MVYIKDAPHTLKSTRTQEFDRQSFLLVKVSQFQPFKGFKIQMAHTDLYVRTKNDKQFLLTN